MGSLAIALGAVAVVACTRHQNASTHTEHAHHEEEAADLQAHHADQAIQSMTDSHSHLGPHFRWTAKRMPAPEDRRRADATITALRAALAPYRDYRQAIKDGYEPFLPHVEQPHYHFTSKWRGFKAAFRFNPAEPTSLLYKKTAEGYALEGAMYTAPKGAGEDALDERIPLSVAQWHAHVNICLPPKRGAAQVDWRRFGPRGSIVTEAECAAAGGRFYPQLFGWMIHVYPFAETAERIWTH